MQTPSVNLIVIRSPDMDRAKAFYEILGLTFTRHRHGTGPEHLAAESTGFVFEIYPQRDAASATTSVRMGFAVAEVDALVAQLAEQGAAIVSHAKDSPWGRRAVVKDFDGHTVELSCQTTGEP